MTTQGVLLDLDLEPAPSTRWGRRLRDCREERELSLKEVVELLDDAMSMSTISALEKKAEAPTGRSARRNAAMLMVLYGYDPQDLGLSFEDLGLIDLRAIRARGYRWVARGSNPEPTDSRFGARLDRAA